MKKVLHLFFLITFCYGAFSQNDTINRLDEIVVIGNVRLQKNSQAYKLTTLNDSIITSNLESFTTLLRFNAPIYFREHGQGGTSSASFRGTSAANTAVMWNGININAINNGQTGFNSLTVGLLDEISVRSGGGSIEFGSGAIGGTIHLNDNLKFTEKKQVSNQLVGSIGSFSTYQGLYKLKQTSKKHSFNIGTSFNTSKNDYPFINSDFKNSNGNYTNYGFNFSNTYKFSEVLEASFYTNYYFGDRLFSGELPNPTFANDKYQDINQKNLLALKYQKNKIVLTTRFAYLFQEYRYFPNKDTTFFNFGSSDRFLVDFTGDYNFTNTNATLSANTRYESVFGRTDEITERNRREFSQSFIFNHRINKSFSYDVKMRKDFNSDFNVPFSYSFGFKLTPFGNFFLRANNSMNYRVPTYNDLYWPGQGNENLIPETSLQGEFGIGFKTRKVFLDIAYFNINTKDKIIWLPNGNPERPGIWSPINLNETLNQGIELTATINHTILDGVFIDLATNYSYVLAKDKEIDKLLPFVPQHLVNTNLSISKGRWSLFYQQLFNGKIYTTQSNSEDYVIDAFYVSNIGINYALIKTDKQNLGIGIKLNNLLNEDYVVVENRPMPGVNYNFNINYKF